MFIPAAWSSEALSQINVITVEPVYLGILATDGKVWEELSKNPPFFSLGVTPMDRAIHRWQDGVFAYCDRVR